MVCLWNRFHLNLIHFHSYWSMFIFVAFETAFDSWLLLFMFDFFVSVFYLSFIICVFMLCFSITGHLAVAQDINKQLTLISYYYYYYYYYYYIVRRINGLIYFLGWWSFECHLYPGVSSRCSGFPGHPASCSRPFPPRVRPKNFSAHHRDDSKYNAEQMLYLDLIHNLYCLI